MFLLLLTALMYVHSHTISYTSHTFVYYFIILGKVMYRETCKAAKKSCRGGLLIEVKMHGKTTIGARPSGL